MKFYTASSFKNIESVRNINQELQRIGCIHTYDWTQNDRASSREELERIGREEKRAVMESDFIIVLLPAGKGSHIELGIALGLGKKVFLYSPENAELAAPSTFYHLPEVEQCFGSLDDLLVKVEAFQHISV